MSLGALQGVGMKATENQSGGYVQEVILLLWKLLDVNKVCIVLDASL